MSVFWVLFAQVRRAELLHNPHLNNYHFLALQLVPSDAFVRPSELEQQQLREAGLLAASLLFELQTLSRLAFCSFGWTT